MRLTRHTDYALRLLMLLALEPDRVHTIEEVARRYRISRNHLMKITQTLAQAGFVDSLRGRGGGLRLGGSVESINLGAVVRAAGATRGSPARLSHCARSLFPGRSGEESGDISANANSAGVDVGGGVVE